MSPVNRGSAGRKGKRIATARIYGQDAHGRDVLIAAPGHPVPDDLEVDASLVESTARSGPQETTRNDGPKPKRRKRTTRSSAAAKAKAAEEQAKAAEEQAKAAEEPDTGDDAAGASEETTTEGGD